MKQFIFSLFAAFFLSLSPFALAQASPKGDPVEITADEAIEWLRDENLYRARGNAIAKQKNISVSAETLSAFYDPEDNRNITEIHADGGVAIESNGQKAVGDKGVYNVQTQVARLTGSNLSVKASGAAVTARESLEYHLVQRKAIARGQAQASDGENTINAAVLTAWLMNNAQGKTVLKQVTATGGIRIETPTEIILGDKGHYDAANETATVEGNVKITRGDNQLNGDKAVVNLKTGVSQLLAQPGGKQERVRALFYPGDDATPLGTN